MLQKPDTFRALIARLGGVSAFADKTRIGEFAAKKMRDRNSIAVPHWPIVIEAARDDGLILTSDDLMNMKLHSQPAPSSEQAA